jgi:Ca2+-binding RTX toxin-like protein
LVEGDLANPVDASQAVRNGHAFLEDIAHNAVPKGMIDHDRNPATPDIEVTPDADAEVGNAIIPNQFGMNETYDNELLDRHFIAGDGRGNENFGLTAVHHIFHTEHNRQVAEMKQTIIDSGELTFINEWLRIPVDEAGLAALTNIDDLAWSGERLFQAAKFATEMQYQHLAFEEFGRRVQPQIAAFVDNGSAEIDGAILAEFAHVVYRFGHSMLTENVHTMDPNGVNTTTDLITAFLNPVAFDQDQTITSNQAAGAVVRGMTRETGANIDEFLTSALRDNLVGLPLDLAALNIARGRDAGVPSLNAAREQFYAATGSEALKPYDNWLEYGSNLKNPASVVNFIAAYGTHDTIVAATTMAEKRAAATDLVLGGENAPADRLDFINGTGAWAGQETGINDVEFWIGGLAEAIMPFGGMLGSSFGFVFQHQMENLQNADRFYYLARTAGMNMLAELENNSFASIVARNTDISEGGASIPGDLFSSMEYILEVDQNVQSIPDPTSEGVDPFLAAMGTPLVQRATATVDAPIVDGARSYENLLQFNGGEHVVLGGTGQRDILVGGLGDDALWGGDGNDLLIGGSGVNTLRGGAGDDIIRDGDDVSFLHGEDGNDVIAGGAGIGELMFGGKGNDAILMGSDDAAEAFGMDGNDFIFGGAGAEVMFGGEGDDWIEGGDGFDLLMGDVGDPFGGSRVLGHDVLNGGQNDNDLLGESGDDILIQGEGVHVNDADLGYDWIAHKDAMSAADIDLTRRLELPGLDVVRDRYINAEAASGTQFDDKLFGDNRTGADLPAGVDILVNDATLFGNELTQDGVDRIAGLREMLGDLMGVDVLQTFTGGNILLGGGGSDTIQGRGGDDVIDGDRALDVRISVRDPNDPTIELRSVNSLIEISGELLDGTINPGQLQIVREIVDAGQEGDVDTAVYFDVRANYSIRANADGSVSVAHIAVPAVGDLGIDANNGDPNPAIGDGVDKLWNVEVLRFADMEVDLRTDPAANGVVMGTAGDDVLLGSNGPDVVFAGAGNDTINGLAGNDLIFAEAGSDTITWDAPNGGYDVVAGHGFVNDGGTDMLIINGDGTEDGFTMYTVAAWAAAGGTEPLDPLSEIIITRTVAGVETAIMEIRGIEEITLNGVQGIETINAIGDFAQTSLAPNTIYVNGTAGNEVIDFSNFLSSHRLVVDTGAGDDVIIGGAGNDILLAGDGRDDITWSVGGGSDVVDGGAGNRDTYTINGDASNETFNVYSIDAWTGAPLNPGTDIVITRAVDGGPETVIGQLQNIEEIQINTAGGVNDVQVFGNFNNTALNFNTIHVTTEGDVSVDVTQRLSTHRVFVDAGGTEQNVARSLNVEGIVTEGDVFLIPVDPATLTRTMDGLTVTETSGNFSMTYMVDDVDTFPVLVQSGTPMAAALRDIATVNEQSGVPEGFGFGVLTRGTTMVTADDIAALEYMVGARADAPILPPEPGQPAENEPANLLQEVRDMEGLTNNAQNPDISGAATLPYMRVTEARYAGVGQDGAGIVNPVFDGLDARAVSNVLGTQEADAAKAATVNMFMMSFGQYFDHGLTFIPKGVGPNGEALAPIQIGGPGASRNPMDDNPADLTRANVVGYDADGTPLHENYTSPVVDQNQVYGSSTLVSQFLRESDGQRGFGSKILMGADDPSAAGFQLMSTLRETLNHHIDADTVFKGPGLPAEGRTLMEYYPGLRDADGNYDAALVKQLAGDFMGEGWPLLIDTNPFMNLLDHYVGGDGRANENVGLTSVHTVWARNHNYQVDQIEAAGFVGTQEQLFQAARILNIGEYQQVVFNDFADSLLGGLQGSGRHGHDKYNPNADARISHEFAGAAYRFGHSQIGEMMTLKDADGNSIEVPLFDLFLNATNDPDAFQVDHDHNPETPMLTGVDAVNALTQMGYVPQPGYAQHGVANILGGLIEQPSEQIDPMVVDAVRTDLVRSPADLFAFNVARGRDLGLGTLNQVKAELAASTDPYIVEAIEQSNMNMAPCASWEDFQARNNLSEAEINKFKAAYPDLVLAGDDIAAFQQVNPDIVLRDGENGTKIVDGIDRVDLWVGGLAESHIEGGVVGHTFWVLIHEQLDRLQEGDRFYYIDRIGDLPVYNNFISNITFGDVVARNTGMTDVPLNVFSHVPEADDQQAQVAGATAPEAPATDAPAADEPQAEAPEAPEAPATDAPAADEPQAEAPEAPEAPATDAPAADEPEAEAPEAPESPATDAPATEAPVAETPAVEMPEPLILNGTDAADMLKGGDANDVIRGGARSDFLIGGAGDDIVMGGACNDDILGGAGNDMLYGDAGNDRIFGDDGDDMIAGGTGSDMLYGGAGDDTFIGMDGDGNDIAYGGAGSDTLDLSAMTEAMDIRLGNVGTERGSVKTATQSDTIWSIENVIGGSGDDRIVASEAVNVLDGGDGNDTFVFETASGANGTTILGFSAGDVLCFRDIDADSSTEGHDAFTLAGRDANIGAGQLTYSHGAEDGENFTTVTGMTDQGDFQLKLSGHITLEEDNFLLA